MKSFIFLKVCIFKDFLILNALFWKYIANITFKQFAKWCLTLWFYNFIKKSEKKRREKMIKKQKKNKKMLR